MKDRQLGRYRIGVPKGRLLQYSLQWLGLEVEPKRSFVSTGGVGCEYQILFLKAKDIPNLVLLGQLEIGLAPTEWFRELSMDHMAVPSGVEYCAEVALLARDSSCLERNPLHLVTEFPEIAKRYLVESGLSANITQVSGSAEAFGQIGSAVVDVVETGATARNHCLRFQRTLFKSHLLVASRLGNWEDVLIDVRRVLRDPRSPECGEETSKTW